MRLILIIFGPPLEQQSYMTADWTECDEAAKQINRYGLPDLGNIGGITNSAAGSVTLQTGARPAMGFCVRDLPACTADMNGDGGVTPADQDIYFQLWQAAQQ